LDVALYYVFLLAPYFSLLLDLLENRESPKIIRVLGWIAISLGVLLAYINPDVWSNGSPWVLPSLLVVLCSFWMRNSLGQLVVWLSLGALNLSVLGGTLFSGKYWWELQRPLQVAGWLVPLLAGVQLVSFFAPRRSGLNS